jgi:queuine tRNA-ribosyltransferase
VRACKPGQALFAIVQGGTHIDLRIAHAQTLAQLPVQGIALGGFSVGEPNAEMHVALREVVPAVDEKRPRYLMGVGTPEDLLRAIAVGVDVFDCVMPTRNARNGQVFTKTGKITIKNARYQTDPQPLEPGCTCPACGLGISRAYLRHLFVSNEILGHRWLTLHNLHHYGELVAEARLAIAEGRYESWANERLAAIGASPL